MIGFYILLLSLGCSNWLSVIGAVAYAFCSYNIVIIDAGRISQVLSSSEVRTFARDMVRQYGLDYELAKRLACMAGNENFVIPEQPEQALVLWEAGRDCHNMQLAARHAVAIVRSVKELGGKNRQREPRVKFFWADWVYTNSIWVKPEWEFYILFFAGHVYRQSLDS